MHIHLVASNAHTPSCASNAHSPCLHLHDIVASNAHTPCCASNAHTPCLHLNDIFYISEGDLSWLKRDWPQHFQVKLFSHLVYQRTSCISWRMNLPLLNILPLDFWNNFLRDAVFIEFLWHKFSERITWV